MMKKLALGALFAGLAACGGGEGNGPTTVVPVDSGSNGPTTCNPLSQTGCNAGEKCTWINDQDNPPIGHVGCAPEGSGIAIGAACTDPPAGPMGYDECETGSVCLAGVCKQICDLNGGTPTCDGDHSCTRYADFFESGGTAVAGVCDPACDPLTQELKVGNVAACGSPQPAMPNSGCYGTEDFSCAPTGMASWALTDRQPPRTNAAGNPYLNGCAPGFVPFFYEATGSTTAVCSGLCAAMESHDAATNPAPLARAVGDATALAKNPTDAAAVAGRAQCTADGRGSSATSRCRFLWPFLIEEATGELPPLFDSGPYRDKLGVCMDISFYNYDHDMSQTTPNRAYPSCDQLSLTMDKGDGLATEWGCMTIANTPATFQGKAKLNPAMQNVRMPKHAELELVRHSFN